MKALLIIPFILLGIYSCKKDDKKNVTPIASLTKVRYSIQPINSGILDVRYTDAEGSLVIQNGGGNFVNGIKEITLTTKPFLAKVGIRVDDLSPVTSYEVAIFVNGELKNRDTIVNIGTTISEAYYVEYTLE